MTQPETESNLAQSKLWNARAGEMWVEQRDMLDRLFQPIEAVLADAAQARGAREVLDIGCGAGATTLAVARRLGRGGRCTGADLSIPLIEAARQRAEAEGVENAQFVVADAQDHAFEASRFDALISRFGVMFFGDPVLAFANLRRASQTGAGLTAVVWRGAEENPFMTAAGRAATPLAPELFPPRDPTAPGQFAFADPDRVRGILVKSGWRDVDIRPLDVACTLSEDDLATYVTRMGPVGLLLPELDEERRGEFIEAVRQAFDIYVSSGVAKFTAACWIVQASN